MIMIMMIIIKLQVTVLDINNLHIVILYEVFLPNYNNIYTLTLVNVRIRV